MSLRGWVLEKPVEMVAWQCNATGKFSGMPLAHSNKQFSTGSFRTVIHLPNVEGQEDKEVEMEEQNVAFTDLHSPSLNEYYTWCRY